MSLLVKKICNVTFRKLTSITDKRFLPQRLREHGALIGFSLCAPRLCSKFEGFCHHIALSIIHIKLTIQPALTCASTALFPRSISVLNGVRSGAAVQLRQTQSTLATGASAVEDAPLTTPALVVPVLFGSEEILCQILRPDRNMPDPFPGGREHCIRDCRCNRWNTHFADARWVLAACNDMYFHLWHLVNPENRIIIKIALLNPSLFKGDGAVEGG